MGDDLAEVDHGDRVGERVGLLEVLRGQEDAGALGGQHADQVPDVVALAGIEARGRLVEEDHLGPADQARGEVEAPPHATGVRLDATIGGLGEPELIQQLRGTGPGVGPAEVEQAGEQLEVLPAGQLLVDRGVLPREADRAAYGGGIKQDVVAGDGRLAGFGLQQRREDADCSGLARTIGTEDSEDGAFGNDKVDAVESDGVAVVLREPFGFDGVVGHGNHAGRRHLQVAVISLAALTAADSEFTRQQRDGSRLWE